ncbi:hypothetical protein Micbo1qcDRAFT_170126 [Microdochium bolleyi]|uniref:Uncharacterized protein n=1 Tax=Microdochium bolleyi TaxID=196109 RepID=A0A136IHZ0_9PEZI|nr:hypothetical protein Micbo1qcDRAFT_170126 [Microdochium bolleyi]
MADPFGITTGVVGIVVPALHATRLLLDDLRKISDAPSTVEALREDVGFVEATLESLKAAGQPQWTALGGTVAEQSEHAITSCTASCTNDISWRDRAGLGFFRESQIKAMSEQLQKYRATLTLVISTATLQSSIRGQRITEELKATITDKEKNITDSITSTNQQLMTVDTRLQQLHLAEGRGQNISGMVDEDEAGMRRVFGEEQAMLRVLLALLEGLKLKTQEEAKKMAEEERKQSMHVTFGDNNSGFQLGANSGSISGFTFGGRGV